MEAYHSDCLVAIVKFPVRQIAWESISSNEVGQQLWMHLSYTDILEECFNPVIWVIFKVPEKYIFQHDRASSAIRQNQ